MSRRAKNGLESPRTATTTLIALSVGGLLTAMPITPPASAQVTTHPREMGLGEAPSPRPNPEDHRIELPNGLVAYAAIDNSVPLVTWTAFVGLGYVDGPEGAAEALADGLRRHGPAGMDAGAFAEALRSMTAEYTVTLGPERLEIILDVPAEDAWQGLALLAGLVNRGPALSVDDLTAMAGRAPSAAAPDYEGSLASAAALFRRNVLGGGPYGHVPTAEDFSALTVDDMRRFADRYFVSENIVLAGAGPVTMESLRRALAEGFGSVPSGTAPERARTSGPEPARSRRVLTYPVDKLQGWLVIGHELPIVPARDQAALEVMNYILGGGHFDTRLFRATRDSRGITNDDSGFPEASRDGPGTYGFHTYGRPEVVRLLLHLTLREIERMRSEPVSEEELFVARGALAEGVFAAGYRDGWSTARTLAAEWLEHGDHDASATYQDRIRAVTADDVRSAARAYLGPERMLAVLVGPIELIEAAPALEDEGALADYGEVARGR